MSPDRVLIVGAGLAGSRCAQTLRAEGFGGAITLIGEEPHPPYERPALSKEFLAGSRRELALQPASHWHDNDIRLLLGTRVEQIDVAAKLARTPAGEIGWDALVLDDDRGSLEARYFDAEARLVAALLVNKPRTVAQLRRQLATERLAA